MICPHCGRSTKAADVCQYCHKPTEFTTRFNSRPGPIPGIEDTPFQPPIEDERKSKACRVPAGVMFVCVATSMIACALSIMCLFQIGRMSRNEELPPATVPETTSMPVADCVISFDWNLQDKNEQIPSISKGGTLPTLEDSVEYLFVGWNTDPSGHGTSFRSGEIFDLELKQDLILFAQWTPVPEETESTQLETEFTDAAQEAILTDTFEPDIQDSNTQASIPDSLPNQESEESYG